MIFILMSLYLLASGYGVYRVVRWSYFLERDFHQATLTSQEEGRS